MNGLGCLSLLIWLGCWSGLLVDRSGRSGRSGRFGSSVMVMVMVLVGGSVLVGGWVCGWGGLWSIWLMGWSTW